MHHGHLTRSVLHLARARLVGVERKMAQRGRRHHQVGPGIRRLFQAAHCHRRRGIFLGGQDVEAAAARLAGVVHWRGAQRRDQVIERGRVVGVLEARLIRWTQQMAAVERSHMQARERVCHLLSQALQAIIGHEHPQQVFHLHAAGDRAKAR